MASTQGSARQEAERLVATVLAMAAQSGWERSSRAGGLGALGDVVAGLIGQAGHGSGGSGPTPRRADPDGTSGRGAWATGGAECCVCPVCKVIAGLRDPSPETAERLATGAGDFATGVASLLRAFSAVTGDRSAPPAPRSDDAARTDDAAWTDEAGRTGDAAATPAASEGGEPVGAASAGCADPGVWAAATATVRGGEESRSAAAGATAGGDENSRPATAGRPTGGDPWAAATATTGDPTATVPRRPRPVAQPVPPAASGPEPASGPASWVRAGTARRDADPWAAATAPAPTRLAPDPEDMDHGAAGHGAGAGDEARPDGVV